MGIALLHLFGWQAPARAADTRTVEGTVAYRERIALPADAYAIVEARNEAGALLAETRIPSEGRQVPFPYRLELPAGSPAVLRAAIYVGGQPRWASEPVTLAAGGEAAMRVEIMVRPFRPMGFASTLRCGDAEVTVGFVGQGAVMEIGGERIELAPVAAASGARFEAPGDPTTFFWNRDRSALVSLRGNTLPECMQAAAMPGATFRAKGEGPDWSLEITSGVIAFTSGPDRQRVKVPTAAPQRVEGALIYRMAEAGLTVRVSEALCRDAAGMPHPQSVTVEGDGRTFAGCGGDPAELLTGPEWVVEDIGGGGIIDRSRITMEFGADDRVAGLAGCNRYVGTYALTAEGLTFGRMAGTMMACADALMAQERKFLAALGTAARFDLDETGALLLRAADGTVALKARR